MKVAELKAYLAEMPDDGEVLVSTPQSDRAVTAALSDPVMGRFVLYEASDRLMAKLRNTSPLDNEGTCVCGLQCTGEDRYIHSLCFAMGRMEFAVSKRDYKLAHAMAKDVANLLWRRVEDLL